MGEGTVNIRGKEYETVPFRVHKFRELFPISEGWGLCTEILHMDEKKVVVKARAIDPDGRTVAEGTAEELRADGNINRTSCLENCETSAIGRCLASAGMGGVNFASAEEVQIAIEQQQELEEQPDPVEDGEDWIAKATPQFDKLIVELTQLAGKEEGKKRYQRLLRTGYSESDWRKLTRGSAKAFYCELEKMVNVLKEDAE